MMVIGRETVVYHICHVLVGYFLDLLVRYSEYVHVFEPLLFEECRAQLHNVWEELLEGSSTNVHAVVSIKKVDRRERGWYDVVLMPLDSKRQLHFKEGNVVVLSTPKPGSGSRRKGRVKNGKVESTEEGTIVGCVAGFVRRFVPVDVRDLPGAVFQITYDYLQETCMGRWSSGSRSGSGTIDKIKRC